MRMSQALVASLPLLFESGWSGAAPPPCPIPASQDRAWLDASVSPECRADALIAQLHSLDDKLAVLQGGLQRYAVTDSRASDGPAGPTHVPGVASLPNGLAVASSFDIDLAQAYGTAVGSEFRAGG